MPLILGISHSLMPTKIPSLHCLIVSRIHKTKETITLRPTHYYTHTHISQAAMRFSWKMLSTEFQLTKKNEKPRAKNERFCSFLNQWSSLFYEFHHFTHFYFIVFLLIVFCINKSPFVFLISFSFILHIIFITFFM